MKGSRNIIFILLGLFVIYVIAEVNKPKPIDWTETLSNTDKNPYGGYIVYNQLKHIFPNATIRSNKTSVYRQINNSEETNAAYFILGAAYRPSKETADELKNYVKQGNYAFISAGWFNTPFLDSLGLETNEDEMLARKDSTTINFVNPALRAPVNYTFSRGTIDQYFAKMNTANTVVLSTNDKRQAVYVRVSFGKGAFFMHADPLCFSNYFLLFRDNASYASKALSYIPASVNAVYWDEHEKIGVEGPQTPLRFLLSNEYLRWALWLSLIGMVLYVLFEMKRRQRVIPIVEPLKNSTLDFIKTVAGVYYNEKDNRNIAQQKLTYFLEYVRNRFGLNTSELDDEFAGQLSRKSGIDKTSIDHLLTVLHNVSTQPKVSDKMLLDLNRNIDHFYKQV